MNGGCLCEDIRYELTAPLGQMANCHCSMCRKAHGTAFSTIAPVESSGFRWTRGGEALAHYESSPGKRRWFCSRCGSHLVSTRDANPDSVLVRCGSLDGDPGRGPAAHGWVESSAPWHEISDELPQFERGFPGSPPGVEGS